jgi:hypothetical protein
MSFMPALTITEAEGRIRLRLGGLAHGEGGSLQEAADDLIRRIVQLAAALRSGGFSVSREVAPDVETMGFLHEVGELAAAGGDVRARIFA